MKQKKLLPITLIAAAAFIISSCGTSRPYSSYPGPHSRTFVSLIITPSPGFTMNTYPDGRYYHRTPEGFIYWKGNDNRFFLDRKYISGVNYNRGEYHEWKRWHDQDNRYNNRRHSY
jgi:hypothetical protein